MQESTMSNKPASQLFGLPDELFTPRRPGSNVITKRDIRAITLAHLGLHENTTLWDIGSGTGSVAIEAAYLASAGHVYAIECHAEAVEAIKANCHRLHAPNVSVIAGRAPQVLHDLPDPHAVFIGGSGGALTAILEVVMARLRPHGQLVVNLATIEHLSEAVDYFRQTTWIWECSMVNIAHTQNILDMTRFAAVNPVFMLTVTKKMKRTRDDAYPPSHDTD
jgi:precorrin-6B C5,15-methyltransferase / cobalt-precorrin-6B C5,C15-methyltransferase